MIKEMIRVRRESKTVRQLLSVILWDSVGGGLVLLLLMCIILMGPIHAADGRSLAQTPPVTAMDLTAITEDTSGGVCEPGPPSAAWIGP